MIKARARLKSKKQLSHFVLEFTFEMVEPKFLDFTSGQYIAIIIDTKTRRQYSIASSPLKTKNEFVLVVDIKPNGPGVNLLLRLNPGNEISFIGPTGNFVIPENLANDLFFISTGTGVAPLKSMIESLISNRLNIKHNIHVHFGTRFVDDLFYTEVFDVYLKEGKIKEYVKYLSQEEFLGTVKGYVTQFIIGLSDEFVFTSQFFICGGGLMVESACDMLLKKGVSADRIFYEKFN